MRFVFQRSIKCKKLQEPQIDNQVVLLNGNGGSLNEFRELEAREKFEKVEIELKKTVTDLTETNKKLRQQLMNSQMTITALEQQIETQVNEIENGRKLLQNLTAKDDEIFALKQQVQFV